MAREELERIQWRQLAQASGDQLSCVKRRRVPRRIVIIFAKYGLRLIAFKPFRESGCPFGIGGILENSSIINERFGSVRLAANGQAHIWVVSMNILTTQVDFLGQG